MGPGLFSHTWPLDLLATFLQIRPSTIEFSERTLLGGASLSLKKKCFVRSLISGKGVI